MLQPEREDRLLDLARKSALLRQEEVFRQLLGQRRAALHRSVANDVLAERAHNSERIDAPMAVEAPVLDRDEGFRQVRRQVLHGDRRAAGIAAIGEQRAVHGQHGDIGRALGHRELVDMRQLRAIEHEQAAGADHAPDRQHETPVEQAAEQGAPRLFLRLAARGLFAARAAITARGALFRDDARRGFVVSGGKSGLDALFQRLFARHVSRSDFPMGRLAGRLRQRRISARDGRRRESAAAILRFRRKTE